MKILAGAALGVTLLLATPAMAKTSVAERFDTVLRLQRGGVLEVTETLVMRFEDGTFKELTRPLGGRRNDGVEILDVWMDGRRVALGDSPGQASLQGSSPVKLRWRFPPTSASTHTFAVRYLVKGAVAEESRGDVLTWRAPSGKHQWRVESSTITYELPAGVSGVTLVNSRRASDVFAEDAGAGGRIVARDIRSDGWAEAALALPSGSILDGAPAWQRAARQRAQYATTWAGAAGLVLLAGLIPIFALRQGFDRTPHDDAPPSAVSAPDDLPPALAGAIIAGGKASLEHAAAALLALADRGVIRVDDLRRGGFGTRTFRLTLSGPRPTLAPHEGALIDALFERSESSATLSKARGRLIARLGRFGRAVNAELDAQGLLDRHRQTVRTAYLKAAGALFGLAVIAAGTWPLLIRTHGGWPLLVPAALSVAAIVALIMRGISTPLANDAIRRAKSWGAYKKHLKSLAKERGGSMVAADALPYAIAFGLGGDWSKWLKKHPVPSPLWFHSEEGETAYAAFIADATAAPQHGG